jgi:hypothetical protein
VAGEPADVKEAGFRHESQPEAGRVSVAFPTESPDGAAAVTLEQETAGSPVRATY